MWCENHPLARARRVVVGLGGSATNDGGAGMLAALGLQLLDDAGLEVEATPRFLGRLARVHFSPERPRLPELVAATDVDSPLLGPHGASATFGPQKGASPRDVRALERSLDRLAEVLGRDLPGVAGLEHEPGAGAAGGLGYGLLVLGASAVRGFDLVSEAVGLPSRLARADVLVTGEGSLDAQSLRGKVVAGAAAEAAKHGCRCLVLAGRVHLDPGEARAAGIGAAHSVVEVAGSLREARAKPALQLGRLAEKVARRM
jgi:glycerate kinase